MPTPPSTTFARHFAAHFAEVEVDIETGEIRLTDYLATQDSGTVVNPQVLKNQAICGARGAGEAPIAAAISAISQAIYNAIGARVDMPMTPERVVRALGFGRRDAA